MVAPPIFAEVLGDKISHNSIRGLYMRCRMKLTADPVNIPKPQFMDLGISTINALDKSASLWNPATRVGRPTDVTHGRVPDHIFEIVTAVREKVSAKSDYSYKTDFEIWRENQDSERQKNARSQPC